MKRREFLIGSAAIISYLLSGCVSFKKREVSREISKEKEWKPLKGKSKVYIIKTENRKKGIKELLQKFDLKKLEEKKVALKANYNSADAFPATTHIDTLAAIVDELLNVNANIILAERSGMGYTDKVLEKMGVIDLARQKRFDVVALDNYNGWIRHKPEGSHWRNGYLFADVFANADAIIQTCCLKTHRFGGHFTMSLKNSVGMVARYENGYDYMAELHGPHQRKMIAEINTSYQPYVVIMDAIKGFSHEGPEKGTLISPRLILASRDRVAIDAAGVAILRIYGTTPKVSRGSVFEQEQIARAVELGLGAASPEDIDIIPLNEEAEEMCIEIETELQA
jgi:uncharacterized protein (DUF362 family)